MNCSEDATAAALDLAGLPADEEIASSGCFDFHHRTRSFDLPQSPSKHRLSKLANLLRSRSDGNVRSPHFSSTTGQSPRSSPRASPHASPGPPNRRRFIRVVRDSAEGDLENPHVIHKYSSEFLSSLQKPLSADEHQNCPPPYTVTGHTILKRQPLGSGTGWATTSVDHVPEASPTLLPKHASFRDEVEIMEYDKKEKIRRGLLAKRKVRLHDSPVGSAEEEDGEETVETSGETGQGDRKKRVTFSDSLHSAASLDVPSENSVFAHIFTTITPPLESSKSSGLPEWSGDGSVCPSATPSILSDKPSDAESQRENTTQSDTISESLQKLDIHSSGLTHPFNTGPSPT